MSIALKKADGDLFIDPETGRSEVVSGPNKVNQELFSLYATEFDIDRSWGSRIENKFFKGITSLVELRSRLFTEVNDANNRMLAKQQNDLFLDVETEQVRSFTNVNVFVDPSSQSALFTSAARVGDDNTIVGQRLFLDFKPLSLRHVLPPPFADGISFFKGS